jgi:hypothetical protein
MTTIDLKNGKWALIIAICVGVIVIGSYIYWKNTRLEQYEVISSPDGRFQIIVFRRQIWPSAMPGQGSDASGIVRLYDKSGHLLDEAAIPMVQQMNDVVWSPDHVEVPLVFSWQLPK